MSKELGTQVTGPVLELAGEVKRLLDSGTTSLTKDWGSFYVSRVELRYYDGPDVNEIVGYLVPDEAEGKTFDFYTPVYES